MRKVVEKHVKAVVSGIKPVIHSLYIFLCGMPTPAVRQTNIQMIRMIVEMVTFYS